MQAKQREQTRLTLADAQRMIEAAMARADEMDAQVCVAVCDPGGALIALGRMENATAVSAVGAPGKAAAAARFRRASGALDPHLPAIQAVISHLGNNMIPARGGVPIFNDSGDLLGAIAVGGTDPEEDEECAEVGAAAL